MLQEIYNLQSKVTDASNKLDLVQEMSKKEYIDLASKVLKEMNEATERMKEEFKTKPWIEMSKLKTWLWKAIMGLLAVSFIYREVWPKIKTQIK